MSRHFFSGGMMPSDSLMRHVQRDMVVEEHWRVSGLHYARTLDSWLALLDSRKSQALHILRRASGSGAGDSPRVLFNRWRLFLLACSELFAFGGGDEWLVSHYRLARREEA
jgi:cyclopropane-fatty-acyl-phospholipid synthase